MEVLKLELEIEEKRTRLSVLYQGQLKRVIARLNKISKNHKAVILEYADKIINDIELPISLKSELLFMASLADENKELCITGLKISDNRFDTLDDFGYLYYVDATHIRLY